MKNREKEKKSRRNVYVEITRIVLTLAICLHHFRVYSAQLPYGGGYLATDCFFIISGYYIALKSENDDISILKFCASRIKRLGPQYLWAICTSFLIYRFALKRNFNGGLTGYISEALMLPFFNNSSSDRIIPPDWYVGYLLFASIILYVLLKAFRDKKKALLIVLVFVDSIIGVYLAVTSGNLCLFPVDKCLFSAEAFMRAFWGVGIGALVKLITDFSHIRKSSIYKYIMMILIPIESFFLFWYQGWNIKDFIAVFIFSVIFFGLEMTENGESRNKISAMVLKASSLCYMVYLNHYIIAYFFDYYDIGRELDWKVISAFYIISVVIYVLLNSLIQKVIHTLYNRYVFHTDH